MARIYFVTNRVCRNDDKELFLNIPTPRGDLRFGFADVDERTRFKPKNITLCPDSEKDGSFAVFADLQKIMRDENRDTLFFIHGFNNSFEDAMEAAGRLANRIKTGSENSYQPNIIAYCWPSDGKLLKYTSDRQDAQASALGLARAILKYYEFIRLRKKSGAKLCNRDIQLVCHSMGNYLFRHALQSLLSMSNSTSVALFTEVLLFAADEDNDAFDLNYKLLPLTQMARRITVYFNKNDKALAISDDIKRNMTRLGASGPQHTTSLPAMIKPVDVTNVIKKSIVQHDYFIAEGCEKVHSDMVNTLLGVPSETISGRTYNPQAGKYVLV